MSHRRTTLGPIDMNRGAARRSVGAPGSNGLKDNYARPKSSSRSRASMGAPSRVLRNTTGGPSSGPNVPKTRHSMAPSGRRSASIGRRSSIFGKIASKAADPRPISNKQYMQEEIHNLITYLMEVDYQQRISPKILTQPTARDFANIVTFLFQMVDRSYKPVGRVEDDVPAVFKALKYPFGISKTALTAVGSPHTWPGLLASISWLVELLEYDRDVQQAEEERHAAGDDDQAFFFNYLRDSYQAFLSGDDEAYDALDNQIAATFEERYAVMEEEMDELETGNEKLRQQIAALKSEESSLPALQSKRQDYMSDHEKLMELVERLEQHKGALESKRDARQEEYETQQDRLREVEKRLTETQEILDTQELSAKDVEHLRARRDELQQQESDFLSQRDQIRDIVHTNEHTITRRLAELEETVQEYNDLATNMQLTGENAKQEYGYNFMISIDTNGLHEMQSYSPSRSRFIPSKHLTDRVKALLHIDIHESLLPALKQLRNKFSMRATQTKTQIMELSDQVDQRNDEHQAQLQEMKDIEKRTELLETTYSREKGLFDRQQNTHSTSMDSLEQQISEAREIKMQNEELAREYDEIFLSNKASEANLFIQKLYSERTAMEKKLNEVFDRLLDHKQYIYMKLESLRNMYQTRLQDATQSDSCSQVAKTGSSASFSSSSSFNAAVPTVATTSSSSTTSANSRMSSGVSLSNIDGKRWDGKQSFGMYGENTFKSSMHTNETIPKNQPGGFKQSFGSKLNQKEMIKHDTDDSLSGIGQFDLSLSDDLDDESLLYVDESPDTTTTTTQ